MSQKRIKRKSLTIKEKGTMDANITKDAVLQGITIQLDAGMTYVGCRFIGCALNFAGNPVAVRIEGNTFEGCRWNFVGPAGNTINFFETNVCQWAERYRRAAFSIHSYCGSAADTGSVKPSARNDSVGRTRLSHQMISWSGTMFIM